MNKVYLTKFEWVSTCQLLTRGEGPSQKSLKAKGEGSSNIVSDLPFKVSIQHKECCPKAVCQKLDWPCSANQIMNFSVVCHVNIPNNVSVMF